MRSFGPTSLLLLGAQLDLITAASIHRYEPRLNIPSASTINKATPHEPQSSLGEIRVPPFFQDTPIPPANPLLYPTKPFRIVANNWTYPNVNEGKYLAQGAFPPGDILFTTNDSSRSPIFSIDADQRLFHYDTLAQIAADGQPMYAFYGTGWYGLNRAIIVPFNTVERIKEWGYIYHEWSISQEILYAVDPYSQERKPLVMQLCDRSYRNMWVMWQSFEPGCKPIVATIEYVENQE